MNDASPAETVIPTPPSAGLRASARNSAAMGVVRIASYFGFFMGLLFGADLAINSGLRNIETSSFGVTNRIVSGQVNADIVISGSSRAQTHYDPRIIARVTGLKTFNIGRNGSQTDMQLAVLKTYLLHNKKPKLVIHNLDLFSFVTTREIYDPAQYMPYLDEEPIYDMIRRIYPNDAWKWKHLPLYAYAVEDMRFSWLLGLQALLGVQPREDNYSGYVARHTPWTGDFEKFREVNPDGVRFGIEPQGIRDMEELGRTCRDAGIPLLLVYSPEYFEMQDLERNRAEVFAEFRKISESFGAQLLDFSDSQICRNRENFYNSQHLNARGAGAFTTELVQRLNSRWR